MSGGLRLGQPGAPQDPVIRHGALLLSSVEASGPTQRYNVGEYA
jgi:hypothetical protein